MPSGLFRPWLLLLAMVALFLPAAGLRDWWYPDEPDVALPAVEMARRGDWVVPTHNNNAWLDYPPLAYWGARVVGIVTGDITPFGTRLPMLAFALLLVAATMMVGRDLGQSRRGLLAGVVLVGTPALWFHATNLQVDLGYVAFIALGLACYHRAECRRAPALDATADPSLPDRTAPDGALTGLGLKVAAFACFGVAILGKGPLGVLLPGLILTCWHGWNREWSRLLLLAPLAMVALAVALPWYLLLGDRLGGDYVLHELLQQNTDRFGASKRGHGGKWLGYYLVNTPPDLGLWVALVIPALWHGFKQQRSDRSWRLLAVWMLAPLIFFSLASTKRNVYVLPAFPAIALLVAGWLEGALNAREAWWSAFSARAFTWILAAAGLVMLAAALAWPWLPVPTSIPTITATTMAALRPAAVVLGLWLLLPSAWMLRQPAAPPQRPWVQLAGVATVGFSLVMWLVLPVIDTVRTYQPAAAWLAQQVPAGGTVGFHVPGRENTKRPAWLIYLDGRRLEFLTTAAEASAWLAADHTRLLITSPALAATLTGVTTLKEWPISNDQWAVVTAKP